MLTKVVLLSLGQDCCYDNEKLKISYPVEPDSAKPVSCKPVD